MYRDHLRSRPHALASLGMPTLCVWERQEALDTHRIINMGSSLIRRVTVITTR